MLLIEVQNCLSVAATSIRMSQRLQLLPVIGVVINLTVEDDLNRTVLVTHRLMAGS
jgi:hypothetical protein